MACRVPGCKTSYANKKNRHQTFKPPDDHSFQAWQRILHQKGVDNFRSNDRICILHFEDQALEKSIKTYHFGGKFTETILKKPTLAFKAVPTIFSNVSPKPKNVFLESYVVKIDDQVFEKAKAIKVHQESMTSTPNKRILKDVSQNMRSAKRTKSNDIYQTLISAIKNEEQISPHLNEFWIPVIHNVDDKNKIILTLWSDDYSIVEKTIIIYEDMKVDIYIRAQKVHLTQQESVCEMFILQRLFCKVVSLFPCIKADNESSKDLCTGYVLSNYGRPKNRCDPCTKVQNKLNRKINANLKSNNMRKKLRSQCNVVQRKNNRYLKKIKDSKRIVKSLQKKCAEVNKTALNEVIAQFSPAEQAAIQFCVATSQVKNMKGMRYTTDWIYECILLRIKSKKTYDHLRTRRILVLPSYNTLNRYMKRIKGCYGFQSSLFDALKEKTKTMKADEVRGVLFLDEMKLTKSLSFNRQNLKVEGSIDLGKYTSQHQKGKPGDHALVFLFQPFKGTWVQSLGCFLSKGSASGTVLHKIIVECIGLAEKAGLKIDAVTTDGASWNRAMWKRFGITEDNISVEHVVEKNRRLWFISDFPHLVKCVRNFLTHQKRDKNAGIWTPDRIISLAHWYALLKMENEHAFNLKINYKLTKAHLNPEFYQKMNVALAFQFFGVANSMEIFKDSHADLYDCEPSIAFCKRMKSLITAMNCRTPYNYLEPGNEMWKVIENSIAFLNDWARGDPTQEEEYDFLPHSTWYGLHVSLRATLEICEFLVNKCEGFSYMMTARLNQDSLERFFGLMRNCCGSNDHPDSQLWIQMYKLVSTYSLIKPPKGSNISGGEILSVLLNIKDIDDAESRWEQWTGQIDTIIDKRYDNLTDAANVLETHDYFVCSTSDYMLTYISGYVARKSPRFVPRIQRICCEECINSFLLKPGEEIPENHKLIKLKWYGYLKHPSKALFALISILEQCTLETIRVQDLSVETLFHITNRLEKIPAISYVGCNNHSTTVTHKIITFYLTMRMFFICKQTNKNDSKEREETREKRKFAKLAHPKDRENDPLIQVKIPMKRARVTELHEEVPQHCKSDRTIAKKNTLRKLR